MDSQGFSVSVHGEIFAVEFEEELAIVHEENANGVKRTNCSDEKEEKIQQTVP